MTIPPRQKYSVLILTAAILYGPGAAAALAQDATSSQDEKEALATVAATVRQNGHPCRDPDSAARDPQDSSPGEQAWIIHCENATYRVKYLGDEGAEVEVLPQ